MAYTAADLTNIESAIASGVKSAVINGRSVTYHDLAQMRDARKEIMASLAANSATRTPRVSYGCINRR